MVERDIYEVANQLGGYIDEATPAPLATFLRRESREAAKLAARIAELEAENARLTKNLYLTRNERDNLSDNVTRLESEALSRTGAVKGEPTAFLVERLAGSGYGSPRTVIDAAKYDPRCDEFWIGDAKSRHLVTPLYALEPAAPEGQQEPAAWQHIPNCGVDRESKMVHVTGKVFCDPCVAPLIAALNAAGIETVASCCGHGHRPGVIVLRDGRELFIAKDFEEARKVDAAFPTDINGDARPSEQAVTEAEHE